MCGIWGIVSVKELDFDYQTFCTMGVANDSRGGDSCGVFIDGNVEYGTDKRKLFEDFFFNSSLLQTITKSTIALGHCRKASVGAVNEKTAQPVIIKNESGKIEFVVIHNGTIYNYEELAKKYIPEIDIKGMTDSQVMTRIFYYKGYDVLNEYQGGAVFVIVDYREEKPRIFMFKGASKNYKSSTKAEEERPLFLCIDPNKKELVFSSISTQLYIMRNWLEVYSLNSNLLIEFVDGKLDIIKKYSRENCTQRKTISYTYPKNYGYYSFYDDLDDNWGYSKYIDLDYKNNLYKIGNKLCDGHYFVGSWGYSYDKPQKGTTEVWFFNGVALANKPCYTVLKFLKKQYKLSNIDFFTKFENVIRYLSIDKVYPIGNIWYCATSPLTKEEYTGSITPITTQSRVIFKDGIKTSTVYGGTTNNTKEILKNAKIDLSFKDIVELCKQLMK